MSQLVLLCRALLIACGMLLVAGCGGPAANPAPAAKPPTEEFNFVDERDESLTVEEYVALGLPPADRDWSVADMQTAQKQLAALVAEKGGRRLPRYRSKHSGDYFERLTSSANLKQFRDPAQPAEERAIALLQYFEPQNEILKLYRRAAIKEEVRGIDILELMAAQLQMVVELLALVDEISPTVKKEDPDYADRMAGLAQMKRGMAGVVDLALQAVSDRQNFGSIELRWYVGRLKQTFPQIVPRLPSAAYRDTLRTIDRLRSDPFLEDLRPGLSELHDAVKSLPSRELGKE